MEVNIVPERRTRQVKLIRPNKKYISGSGDML